MNKTYRFCLNGVEEDGAIIINVFDCPVCGKANVDSDIYHLWEKNDDNTVMQCCSCLSRFLHISDEPYLSAQWEHIS